jgi:hypothetical protein
MRSFPNYPLHDHLQLDSFSLGVIFGLRFLQSLSFNSAAASRLPVSNESNDLFWLDRRLFSVSLHFGLTNVPPEVQHKAAALSTFATGVLHGYYN